jgi:hypothetical protein
MRDQAKLKATNTSYMLYFQACILCERFVDGKQMHEEVKEKVLTYMKNKVRTSTSLIWIDVEDKNMNRTLTNRVRHTRYKFDGCFSSRNWLVN